MDCDMVRELLETRAVEALDARQARAVDEHLASCVDCERLYDTYRQIAASMPEAVVDAAPYRAPESLRERVLSATRGERRDPHFKRAISVVFRPQVAAAVLSVIFLGISVAWGLHQTAALARERSLRSELSGAIGQQELIFEVVDSPRTVKAFLRATEPGSTSYGKLYTRPDLPDVVALTGRLPRPPDGEVYNFWLTAQGSDFLAGSMSVTEKGFAVILYESPSVGPAYETARVILQPENSTEPTGTTVLRWDAPR